MLGGRSSVEAAHLGQCWGGGRGQWPAGVSRAVKRKELQAIPICGLLV